jgi:hypothetical protein
MGSWTFLLCAYDASVAFALPGALPERGSASHAEERQSRERENIFNFGFMISKYLMTHQVLDLFFI